MQIISANLHLFWERVTFSRLTTAYLTFALVHFTIQVAFQVNAFIINEKAAGFLYGIVKQTVLTSGFAVFEDHELYFCTQPPTSLSAASCDLKWNGTTYNNNWIGNTNSGNASQPGVYYQVDAISSSVPSSSSVSSLASTTTSTTASTTASTTTPSISASGTSTIVQPRPSLAVFQSVPSVNQAVNAALIGDVLSHDRRDEGDDAIFNVTLSGYGNWDNTPAAFSRSCLWVLNYPVEVLDNTKREDIAFIAFQFWLLGMSIVAILNESIPHIIASLLVHTVATIWSGFQLLNTRQFQETFNTLTKNGACAPYTLLPNYWSTRFQFELLSLSLNCLALLVSAFLTWKLFKLFGWQTFKRVGASLTIARVYKVVLVLSVTLQLALFFIVVTAGIWLDQIINGTIASLALKKPLYRAAFIVVLIALVPWLTTGWISIRREHRTGMAIFLVICVIYFGGTGAMFASTTFRWTFVQWTFFGIMVVASASLTLVSFILGVVCRYNFGKGLSNLLQAQQRLEDTDSEPRDDEEKVAFPAMDSRVPTFNFGPDETLNTAQMSFMPLGDSVMASTGHGGLQGQGLMRTSTMDSDVFLSSSHSARSDLNRSNSQTSQASNSSSSKSKRWAIEE